MRWSFAFPFTEPDGPLGTAIRSTAFALVILPLVWVLCRTGGRTLSSIGLNTPASALVVGGALTACPAVRFLLAARSEPTRPPAEQDTLPRRRIPVRGIMYDVGSGYVPGQNSRERWNPSFGIVRPPSLGSALSPDDGHREPKEGFHALARRYGADVPTTADQDRGFSRAVHA